MLGNKLCFKECFLYALNPKIDKIININIIEEDSEKTFLEIFLKKIKK